MTVDEAFCHHLKSRYPDAIVLVSGDDDYEDARSVFNRMHDLHPAMIVRTLNRAALIEVVLYARDNNVELAIKGGGHHIAGFGSTQGGVLIDFSPFNDVEVDSVSGVTRVMPGARLRDVDVALCSRNYVIPTGTVSDTGIAGLTLGGGIGWLIGTLGFTCQHLIGADVLLASGEIIAAEGPGHEDLLWALRGGGGNFGVVLEFRYRLSTLPTVYCGTIDVTKVDVQSALANLLEYLSLECPPNLVVAPVVQFCESDGFSLSVDFCLCGADDIAEILKLESVLGGNVKHNFITDNYVQWQSWSDKRFAEPMRGYWKSICPPVESLDLAARMTACASKMPGTRCSITLEHFNCQRRLNVPGASAFPLLTKEYGVLLSARWRAPAEDEKYIEWVKASAVSIMNGKESNGYSNYTYESKVSRSMFDEQDECLQKVKCKYDPLNVFRRNHNIQKAG